MADEIGEIDLSDFGLEDIDDAPVSTAEPSSEGIPANLMAALGLEIPEASAADKAAMNGQSDLYQMPDYDLPLQVPDLKPGDPYIIPNIANLEPQSRQATSPSTGFGLLEQILLEVSRLNLEIAGLRQQLSILGALGPSVLSSAQGVQSAAAAAPAVEGGTSLTADASLVRRRRGRPRKEDDTEIVIE